MIQYNLDFEDFHGESLLPFERLGPFPLSEIRAIAFYPDHCSSGIWLTVYQPGMESLGDWMEMNVEAEDLPFELDPYFLIQVKAMQESFDAFCFSDAGEQDYEGHFWTHCTERLQARFKTLHPDYAYLIS